MWIKRCTSLGLVGALAMVVLLGCAPRIQSALPAGIALQPGRYLTASYRAPDFAPERTVYALPAFPVQDARGVAPETFQTQLREELSRAFRDNGLKLDAQSDTVLTGTVDLVAVRGRSLRFITGKITAVLLVQGRISRGSETLLAFQDQIRVTSPVNPGPPAPKETELLLSLTARTFASHLLNELLLYGLPAEGK